VHIIKGKSGDSNKEAQRDQQRRMKALAKRQTRQAKGKGKTYATVP
jgi:hypothetical protein